MTTDFLLQTMQARTVEQYFQSTERKKKYMSAYNSKTIENFFEKIETKTLQKYKS